MTAPAESMAEAATPRALRVAFRVDARAEIGIGHFMRCLTLADAVAIGGARVRFVCRGLPAHLQDTLRARGYETAALPAGREVADGAPAHAAWVGASQSDDAHATLQALGDSQWDLLVVDHYGIDARWERIARAAAARLLVIDDLADREHDCDALLDQNLYSDMEARYSDRVPPGCLLMLGPRFALLREEFAALRQRSAVRDGEVGRILIAFGGADVLDMTSAALEAVVRVAPQLSVDVVVGASHASIETIRASCAAHGYTLHVQSSNLARLMADSDLAIGAGGTSLWERCCVGLPALARRVAENQRRQLDDAAARGLVYAPTEQGDASEDIALHLRTLLANPLLLRHLSSQGLDAVDARGTRRVLRTLGVSGVSVRPAQLADSATIHRWRNAPAVRAVSRNSASIERAEHDAWLENVLADPARALLIGEMNGAQIGVVRFDVTGDEAEVSIYLGDEPGSDGLGGDLLAAAESWLIRARQYRVRRLHAEVLGGNLRSHRLFQAAGYAPSTTHYSKTLHSDD